DHQRQLLGAHGLEAALDDRLDDLGEIRLAVHVQLLERPAVELLRRHVGRDGEDGRAVGLGDRQPHDLVAGTGPRRGKCRGDLMGDAEEAVRHVDSRLFVARRDHLDLVLHLVEAVDEAHGAMAAHAEDVGDLLPYKCLGDVGATLLLGHAALPWGFLAWRAACRAAAHPNVIAGPIWAPAPGYCPPNTDCMSLPAA